MRNRHAPLFFDTFHETHERDAVGQELSDKHAAWGVATKTAGEILRDLDGRLKPEREWRMEVQDEFRQRLFVLHISAEKPTER